jgi:hypothetical protein
MHKENLYPRLLSETRHIGGSPAWGTRVVYEALGGGGVEIIQGKQHNETELLVVYNDLKLCFN